MNYTRKDPPMKPTSVGENVTETGALEGESVGASDGSLVGLSVGAQVIPAWTKLNWVWKQRHADGGGGGGAKTALVTSPVWISHRSLT